jgi:proline dehydrogenase
MNLFNKVVVGTLPLVPRSIVRYFASRYIAGDSIEDAVRCVREISADGKMATLDVLGEDIHTKEEAVEAREQNIRVLRAIDDGKLNSNLSIKLTSLGLKLGKEFCAENVREILREAQRFDNFVRVDMEDSTCTSDTIEIFLRLQKDFPKSGIVLQAYMKRSEADARELIRTKTNFRLCKGIYKEPPGIAFQGKEEIRQNFLRLLELMLGSGCYVGIATHDAALVDGAIRIIRNLNLSTSRYEFQMLLGVQPELRQRLVAEGHRMRLYVPFGAQWYAYSMRRFKENPEVAGYVFRALFKWNT